jgi:hypothetical protein
MKRTGRQLSELAAGMPKYPQTMLNVRTAQRMDPDASPQIREAVTAAEIELADSGRIVLRASGTEPVIRVMVEGQDEDQVTRHGRGPGRRSGQFGRRAAGGRGRCGCALKSRNPGVNGLISR